MIFEELKNIERQPDGTPVAAEDLLQLPVFKEVSPQFLKKNANATVWRHFKRGDIVCREGEFGSTAFYILEGKASVATGEPHRARESAGRARADFSAGSPANLPAASPRARKTAAKKKWTAGRFPSTRQWTWPTTIPSRELGPGELFGEMTCMNYYPRSATVRAETDCTMLEMLRNVLDVLQKSKVFPRATGPDLPPARARFPLAQCPDFSRPHAGFYRPPPRPRGIAAIRARAR